jgi:hypothetical protein
MDEQRLEEIAERHEQRWCDETDGHIGVADAIKAAIHEALSSQEEELRESLSSSAPALDLKWAAASEFIRDIFEALGKPQPAPEAIVDLRVLALEVVGQIEELKVAAGCGAETQEERADALEPLVRWIERERALRDAAGKGGQSVGDSPSISPSVLRELERLTAPLVAQPSPETPATASSCVCGHAKAQHLHVGSAAAGCVQFGCECYVYEWAPVSSANHTAANPPDNPPSQGKEGR